MWSKVNLILIYFILDLFLDQTWPGFHYSSVFFFLLNISFLYLIYANIFFFFFFFFFWWKKFSWDLATSLSFSFTLFKCMFFFYVTRFSTYITWLCFDMHVYVYYFPNVLIKHILLKPSILGCSDWYVDQCCTVILWIKCAYCTQYPGETVRVACS